MTRKWYGCLLALALCLALTVATTEAQGSGTGWSGTTWSGTFQSQHSGVSPFTMTVLIGSDAAGNLIGTTSSAADCFTDATLQITLKGSTVVLAGSDPEGNNITFRGALDSSGTILNLSYVLNSSASGRCESDNGSGTLGKR
jgi:hypothetical protein